MKKYSLLTVTVFFLSLSVFAQQKAKAKPHAKRAPIDTSKFVLVEGGTFTMGTDQLIKGLEHEGPAHKVSVNSFYLAKTEMTFEDYDKFCNDTKRDTANCSGWGRGKKPVMNVSWFDAVHYCNWLSEKEKLSKCYLIDEKSLDVKYLDTAKGYRLPTEAEWEFAAKGGNKSQGYLYSGSKDVNDVGWYAINSQRTMPVAQKTANELGLYDMSGNVWEWCWDIYDWNYYKSSPSDNLKGAETGPYRVMRGGAFYNQATYLRTVTRQNSGIGFKQNSVGFRVARTYFD